MPEPHPEALELTYPLRTAARLTGLSPSVLRAWESRYAVVVPIRTAGGTRRYTAADLERLRLLKSAVDAGHRIGQLARLDAAELKRRATLKGATDVDWLEDILGALDRLDDGAAQRSLSMRLSTLGPTRFAHDVALPLVREIGERWAEGRMGIASEHLATSILRSLLGSALQPTSSSVLGPRIVFATPTDERHELGLLIAALTALGAGAQPLYLGVEMPVQDLLDAVESARAVSLALSLVTIPRDEAQRIVETLREGLPADVRLLLGGSGAGALALPEGVESMQSLEAFEQRVALLGLEDGVSR